MNTEYYSELIDFMVWESEVSVKHNTESLHFVVNYETLCAEPAPHTIVLLTVRDLVGTQGENTDCALVNYEFEPMNTCIHCLNPLLSGHLDLICRSDLIWSMATNRSLAHTSLIYFFLANLHKGILILGIFFYSIHSNFLSYSHAVWVYLVVLHKTSSLKCQ